MKVFHVDGPFLDAAGAASRTQELTLNNAPMLELRDLPTTLEIYRLRERHYDEPEKLREALEQRPDAETQLAPGTLPNRHLPGYTMYSQSTDRWGGLVASTRCSRPRNCSKGLSRRARSRTCPTTTSIASGW